MYYLIGYLVIINFIAFFAYGADKRKSVKGKWRTKEAVLLSYSILGGGIGSILGMIIYHHKTKKTRFLLGVPSLTAVSVLFIWIIIVVFNLI